ncbi:hypothetical protein HDU96_008042 [Phlyctochytrium bullatum]|nr:hypothetical protein HDU96_008042 [Phlyctochytrium bullatum]
MKLSVAITTAMALALGPAIAAADDFANCLQQATSSVVFQTSVLAFSTAKDAEANVDAMGSNNPLAFAFPTSATEVAAIIRCARQYNAPVTPRSGGHSYEAYSVNNQGVVIDLASGFTDVRIDTASSTAVVGAGNWLGRVYYLLQQAGGYVLPGGDCPHVGVGGHALGGGFGLISRQLGLVADNLVEVEFVDAEGNVRNVNAQSDPDLFWALRGAGGGNFGIVTSFTFNIYQVSSQLSIYQVTYSDPSVRSAVIKAFTTVFPSLPNEITPTIYTSAAGGLSLTAGIYAPSDSNVAQQLKATIAQSFPAGYTVSLDQNVDGYVGMVQKVWGIDDPATLLNRTHFQSPSRFKATSLLSDQPLSDDALAALVDNGPVNPNSGLSWNMQLMLDLWGGKIADVAVGDTAFIHRSKTLVGYQLYAQWDSADASVAQTQKDLVANWRNAVLPYVLPTAYQNYIDSTVELEAYYGADGLQKLTAVKQRVDPQCLWTFGQSIPCRPALGKPSRIEFRKKNSTCTTAR